MTSFPAFSDPQALGEDGPPLLRLKTAIHARLLETMNFREAMTLPSEELQQECSRRVDALISEQGCPLSAYERQQLIAEVLDEIFGLGPLEEFLRDPNISDILVNGPNHVYIERFGRLEATAAKFRDDNHLIQVIQRIATQRRPTDRRGLARCWTPGWRTGRASTPSFRRWRWTARP